MSTQVALATTHVTSSDLDTIVSSKLTAVLETVADEGVDALAISAIDAAALETPVAVAISVSQINLPAILLPQEYSHACPEVAS